MSFRSTIGAFALKSASLVAALMTGFGVVAAARHALFHTDEVVDEVVDSEIVSGE